MRKNEILHKIRTQVEVYKTIKGYENYMVSSLGNVKNIKTGRILKPRRNIYGYALLNLCSNGEISPFMVHRLVAQAFISNPENKPQVNHKVR